MWIENKKIELSEIYPASIGDYTVYDNKIWKVTGIRSENFRKTRILTRTGETTSTQKKYIKLFHQLDILEYKHSEKQTV